MELKCPKCGSAAITANKTEIPTSQIHHTYVNMKCLTCGTTFDLIERENGTQSESEDSAVSAGAEVEEAEEIEEKGIE